MNMIEYSNALDRVRRKATPDTLEYLALGLAGETGEAIEHIKKMARGDGPIDKQEFLLECGDILYYLTSIIKLAGATVEEVADMNIRKLEHRNLNGKMVG